MANLGSTDTPAAAQSLDLPNGYSPAVEEDSGDLVVNDPNGNTALRWDATNGEWNVNSNDVTNVGALDTEESVTITGDEAITYGRNHGNTIDGKNVAVGVGARALESDVIGDPETTSVGYNAATSLDGYFNTAIGARAAANAAGGNTTVIGHRAATNSTQAFLTTIGSFAGFNNTGERSALLGGSSGYNNDGGYVMAAGYASARDNTGDYLTAAGYASARDNTGNRVSSVGFQSANKNTGNRVVAIGFEAAKGDGLSDVSTMGDDNIGIGVSAIQNNQASGIIAIGQDAGINAQTDDQLIITQRDGTRRMVMDLTTGDLEITGELIENVSL